MILAETTELTIECDTNNAFTRGAAMVQADIMSKYQLEGNDNLEPIGLAIETKDGTIYKFIVRYKKPN